MKKSKSLFRLESPVVLGQSQAVLGSCSAAPNLRFFSFFRSVVGRGGMKMWKFEASVLQIISSLFTLPRPCHNVLGIRKSSTKSSSRLDPRPSRANSLVLAEIWRNILREPDGFKVECFAVGL